MVNYLTTRIKLLIAMLAIILLFSVAQAEDKEDEMTGSQGWYAGVEAGMPFGFSTFSSFGHDKTRLGWDAGVSAQEQLCMGKRHQTGSHPLER